MAPILSKPRRKPTSWQQVLSLANQRLVPVVNVFIDVFAECLVNGRDLAAEAYSQCGSCIDKAVHSTVGLLEDFCGLDLQSNARGPRKPLQSSLPILFVLMLVLLLYNAFVFAYMPAAGIAWNSSVSMLFHAFVFLVLASFVQATRTDPGTVPDTKEWKTKDFPPEVLRERKRESEEPRWCRKSSAYKPDRAHYCRVLKRPVLRMDHHCPWLGNTVGFANHKYFFLFLFYTNAACACLGCGIIELLVKATLPALTTFLMLGAGTLTTVLLSFLLPFFFFHCWLIARNSTTIEFCEKMRTKDGEMASESGRSKYDLGLFRNLQAVLGSNPFSWPFPVGGPSGDGLQFPIRVPAGVLPTKLASKDGSSPEAAHPSPEKQADREEEEEAEADHPNPCLVECPQMAATLGDDFLMWNDAAEFKDDLRVGMEFLASMAWIEDVLPSRISTSLVSLVAACRGGQAAEQGADPEAGVRPKDVHRVAGTKKPRTRKRGWERPHRRKVSRLVPLQSTVSASSKSSSDARSSSSSDRRISEVSTNVTDFQTGYEGFFADRVRVARRGMHQHPQDTILR